MKKIHIILILVIFTLMITITSISYAKYVIDANTVAAKLNIDRTKPIGEVKYSIVEATKENVIATIELNEPVKEVEGWNLSENKQILTKTYTENETSKITIEDLSGNKSIVEVNVQNIDREKPYIEVINVKNTNTSYEKYANKTHTLTTKIRIKDKYIKNNIDVEKINVLVGNNCNECIKKLENLKQTDNTIEFELLITNINGNGDLKIIIPENFVEDKAGNTSQKLEYNTEIMIDNIKPQGSYDQDKLENGKIKAIINSNEEIVNISDWEKDNNCKYTKIFPANVSYIIKITDYAQNESEVEVNVTNATYIVFTYAAHNSEVGWTYGLGNYDIAGKDVVKKDPALKTEALAFRITGKADKDFVRIRGYVHSFWNNLSDYGRCNNTGYKYKLREAPSATNNLYYTMSSSSLSSINGKSYIQLGGAGINQINNRDYYGNNPITHDAIYNSSIRYPYGVSELEISLKEYSELSVVYQILVDGKGWIKTCTNGRTATYAKDRPMTAIRAAIIPNSELSNLVELWDKDVGTYKVD